MSQTDQTKTRRPDLLASATDFFQEMISSAFESRKFKTMPLAEQYLINLLEFYLFSENLFEEEVGPDGKRRTTTMAEKYLKALNADNKIRAELLKRLGDTSLYVSGFFGDSFRRKIIDIDYYVDIGGTAYGNLATTSTDDIFAPVYEDLSHRFIDYVDVLTYISQKSFTQSNMDLLRLYDRYLATGSKLAEEQLEEEGMLNASLYKSKSSKQ